MSNLLVQNIKHTNNTTSMTVDSSGQVTIRGEGSATTTNLQQGLTKAWVNLNGTGTAAYRDSFNTSSLTDDGTGSYTVNFTNDFGNASYSATHAGGQRTVTWGIYLGLSGGPNAAGSHGFHNVSPSDTLYDSAFIFLQFCGDLA